MLDDENHQLKDLVVDNIGLEDTILVYDTYTYKFFVETVGAAILIIILAFCALKFGPSNENVRNDNYVFDEMNNSEVPFIIKHISASDLFLRTYLIFRKPSDLKNSSMNISLDYSTRLLKDTKLIYRSRNNISTTLTFDDNTLESNKILLDTEPILNFDHVEGMFLVISQYNLTNVTIEYVTGGEDYVQNIVIVKLISAILLSFMAFKYFGFVKQNGFTLIHRSTLAFDIIAIFAMDPFFVIHTLIPQAITMIFRETLQCVLKSFTYFYVLVLFDYIRQKSINDFFMFYVAKVIVLSMSILIGLFYKAFDIINTYSEPSSQTIYIANMTGAISRILTHGTQIWLIIMFLQILETASHVEMPGLFTFFFAFILHSLQDVTGKFLDPEFSNMINFAMQFIVVIIFNFLTLPAEVIKDWLMKTKIDEDDAQSHSDIGAIVSSEDIDPEQEQKQHELEN